MPHTSFSLFRFADPDDPEMVVLETLTSDLHLGDDEDLTRYKLVFDWLSDVALTPGGDRHIPRPERPPGVSRKARPRRRRGRLRLRRCDLAEELLQQRQRRPCRGGAPRLRSSTYSNGNGDCVEVAPGRALVGVRDSTDPTGPVLAFPAASWAAFVAGLRTPVLG